MTKRRTTLFVALLALLLVGVCTLAGAAGDPVVGTMELTPAYLTGPGDVNVSITISNTTNEDFKDPVILYDPAAQTVMDFGTDGAAMLKAGESITWTGTYSVNERTLTNGALVYYVKYTSYLENGEAVEQSLPILAKIERQSEAAILDVKRTISPAVAQEGQKVAVKYHISNVGTVSLKDIVITENSSIHKETQKIPELKAGQTADVSYSVVMEKKNITSGATITYASANSEEKQSYVVEDQEIVYGDSKLTAKLTSSSKGVVANSVFTLTLELKNSGSVDFSDIRVTDPVLGEVFSNQKLDAGKSLKLEKELTLPQTSDYQFTVTAIDSTGTESVTGTESITVKAVNPEDALSLTMIATPDKTEAYGNPATVRFSLVITNDSNVDANEVTISHGNVKLHTFGTIPAGESRTLTRDTALSITGKFQFTATAKDPLENNMTFKSNEMQIAIYAPTPAPATPTPPPNPTPEPTFNPETIVPIRDPSIGALPKGIQNVLLPVLVIVGVLLVASCVLLLIATKRRYDQKRASEAAYDHLERARRRDYVTPAEDETPEAALPDENAEDKPQPKKKKAISKEEQDAQMKNRRIIGDDDDSDWELPHIKYAREAASTPVNDDDEPFSAMGHGLYDEEMTSDLRGFGADSLSEDAADSADRAMDESVMYEQPYEDTFTNDADGRLSYEDVYTNNADDPPPYEDIFADDTSTQQLYEDGFSDEAVPQSNNGYSAYADDRHGYSSQRYEDGYGQQADGGDQQAYDGLNAHDDFDPAFDDAQTSSEEANDSFDGYGYGDAFDNQYSGASPYIQLENQTNDAQPPAAGRRRSRQSRDPDK